MSTSLGSTYRLQLAGVGFTGARDVVGYLSALGVATLYVSPVLAATPGSTHGYDVVDPLRLDPALGTREEFAALLATLEEHDVRLLVDIVPNHLAVHRDNPWWWDVLRRGPHSPDAPVFDVDWSRHGGRVLVPTLGRPLEDALHDAAVTDGELVLDDQHFPLTFDTDDVALDGLVARQFYRPAFWRLSDQEGNYRRFFDIDGLIGVRQEDEDVYRRTHELLNELIKDERVVGWRVDHVDGLRDPEGYLQLLRRDADRHRTEAAVIVVEKILGPDERLPPTWPVDGTTGYDFANLVGGLFVDARGAARLAHAGRRFAGTNAAFASLALEGKREVLETSFVSALEQLTRVAMAALDARQPGHDLARRDVRRALGELSARLDVYRTYGDVNGLTSTDRGRVLRARDAARRELTGEPRRALLSLVDVMCAPGAAAELTRRWQQLSGAVTAKGVEDTATYRFDGLLSHAEVGGDPDAASTAPRAFHALVGDPRRASNSFNATSTHDSKRSEDARARLFTLSEVPDDWRLLVTRWRERLPEGSSNLPDGHDQWLIFQSLFALWPNSPTPHTREVAGRVRAYAVKAAREAKVRTSWKDPDLAYERTLGRLVTTVLADPRFVRDLDRFVVRVGPAAMANSLAMVVLKCVAPGVPDFYQGTERWAPTLTDPDNRRPVNFEALRASLSSLPQPEAGDDERRRAATAMLRRWHDGTPKTFVTKELLRLRQELPTLFSDGRYRALRVRGALGEHVVAVARRDGTDTVIAVVPRLALAIARPGRFALGERAWGSATDVLLPSRAGEFRDVFTGSTHRAASGTLPVAALLADFPVCVLRRA